MCGMSASHAAEFNPHGFRHLLLTMGQQFRTLGVVAESDLERLGHWCKGSSMVREYDSNAGVSELAARSSIMCAAREGWRPVMNGMLPMPLPATPAAQSLVRGCPATPLPPATLSTSSCTSPMTPSSSLPKLDYVLHTQRCKWHYSAHGSGKTSCKMWTCGTVAEPAANARFADEISGFSMCRPCASGVGKGA